ncbi:GNAT family N-acetyltransferase [Actinomadura fibrosa]|uniref:GNAT family N-acetyltransferase n=1 Tax=Actinomadura fibrosa TaxID=111802 RepID=A0ABW2XJB1_9ACTN|nr:GNAT family N-acetyltransferase [Actinomadura fibrosa]
MTGPRTGLATADAFEVESRAVRAWPAETAEERGGWLLRHSPGVDRKRSNSALPLSDDAVPDVEEVESFYAERGRPARVQVSPADRYRALDAALAARGYAAQAATLVLTAAAADVIGTAAPGGGAAGVVVAEADDRTRWPSLFGELGVPADGIGVIERIVPPAVVLAVHDAGRPAGMGLFVADTGWAGVFCMATRPDLRRRGIATAVLAAGARWAAAQGADRLYLQVEAGNGAARTLYERAGFTLSHGYHYRVRPSVAERP